MRWRKADLGRRVNGNLELRFGRHGLTSYAGLEGDVPFGVDLRVSEAARSRVRDSYAAFS